MKRKRAFIFAVLLSLLAMMNVAFAETTNESDVIAIIEEMPYEQRMEVVEDILRMIVNTNGIDALEGIFQSVEAEYLSENESAETVIDTDAMTEEALFELLAGQPLAVIETEYLVQSDDFKILYPDMLSAIILNNSDDDIRSAVVAFVAWDENNLPVKIEGQFDFMGGSYVKLVSYDDINLIPGETFGKGGGFSLAENNTIAVFKAIVVSYETFDGVTWENPYFEDFCEFYEGKKLNSP